MFKNKKKKKEKEFFSLSQGLIFQRTAIAIVDYLRFENFTYWEFKILNAFEIK